MQKVILNNKKYKGLVHQKHHLINRYIHCYEVMKLAVKLYGLEDSDLIAGALLHDFFFDEQPSSIWKHSKTALKNARVEFPDIINSEIKHIIKSHMWPIAGTVPRTKKAWCVNLADKIVSLKGY